MYQVPVNAVPQARAPGRVVFYKYLESAESETLVGKPAHEHSPSRKCPTPPRSLPNACFCTSFLFKTPPDALSLRPSSDALTDASFLRVGGRPREGVATDTSTQRKAGRMYKRLVCIQKPLIQSDLSSQCHRHQARVRVSLSRSCAAPWLARTMPGKLPTCWHFGHAANSLELL